MKGLLERFAEFFFSAPGTPFPSANEVLPGVPKPSSILAGMIAVEILKAPDKIGEHVFTPDHKKFSVAYNLARAPLNLDNLTKADIDEAIHDYWGGSENLKRWREEFSRGGSSFNKTINYLKQRDGHKQPYVASSIGVRGIDCAFDTAEKKVIADAITEGLQLKAELEKNKAFHDNQHKAVAAIEALAPRPKPCVEPRYRECDCDAGCPCCLIKEEEKCTKTEPRVTTGSTKTTRKKPGVAASSKCMCDIDAVPGVCICPV